MTTITVAQRSSVLDELGDLYAEKGSRPWAIAAAQRMHSLIVDTQSSAQELEGLQRVIRETEGYRQLAGRDGQPFATYEAFCLTREPWGLGYPPDVIERMIADRKTAQERSKHAAQQTTGEVLPTHRPEEVGNFPTSSQQARASRAGVSDRTQRKLDYVARLPDQSLIARVRAGDVSVDRAYRLARGKPDTISVAKTSEAFARAAIKHLPLDQIKHLIEALEAHASQDDAG